MLLVIVSRMKITPTIFAAILLITLPHASAKEVAKSAAARATLVSTEMKSVDACKNYYNFGLRSGPATFGEGDQRISIQAVASSGQVAIGNDKKAFQLAVNKGIITSVVGGKQRQVSFSIEPKVFISQLTMMNQFLEEALEIAQKAGKNRDVEQVTCASAILNSTKHTHSS